MSEFPKQFVFPDPGITLISTFSPQSIGSGSFLGASTPTSAVYPTSNLAIFIPFRITRSFTFNTMFVYNGAAVSGNVDLGVYSFDGTKLVSSGSTAQAGTSILQSISVTSTELSAGLYYMAIALDNTTGALVRTSITAATIQMMGLAQMSSAFPLPATATFASVTNAYIPLIGLTGRSVL